MKAFHFLVFLSLSVGAIVCHATDTNRITFTNCHGVVVSNVVVKTVEPDGITVISKKGVAKYPFGELPDFLKEKYGYDPTNATRYADIVRERMRVAAAGRQIQNREHEIAGLSESVAAYIESTAIEISGTIFQVVSDGILLSRPTTRTMEIRPDSSDKIRRLGGPKMVRGESVHLLGPDLIFVWGDFKMEVDDSTWTGTIYDAGRYKYTTLAGFGRTIRAYATSPAVAAKHFGED